MNNFICCLPIAGKSNPYQDLMMNGLRASGFNISHGKSGKFFAILRTAFYFKPEYIHIDWLHQYYIRRSSWMTWINLPIFIFELLVVKYFFRTKLVWTLHNIIPHDHPFYGPYKWARQFFAKQCYWIRVFYPSTINRASNLLNVDKGKFKVIPEGSYIGYYSDSMCKNVARKNINIPENVKLVLYFGVVKPYKGVLELTKVFTNLSIPNTKLLIVGKAYDEEYGSKISAINNSNIFWKNNFIPENEVELYFKAADLVVLPFLRIENSGSVVLAMSFGKAVVAPKKGVVLDRLSQQIELLYQDGDLDKILKKALLLSSEELDAIGHRNFKNLEKYSWNDFGTCFE